MKSDDLRDVLEKIPFSLFLVAYLGYLYFDYYQFNNDEASPLILKNKEIDGAKQNKTKLEKKLQEFKVFAQSLDSKKMELRQLAKELQGMKDSLSDTLDIPNFMKMVITEAKKVGLTVTSLMPAGNLSKEYYVEQTFTVQFRGVFSQVASFLQRLSSVNEIIRIDRVDLKPDGSGDGKIVLLAGTLDLKTYQYVGSSADGMGKSDSTQPNGTSASGKDAAKVGTP